MALVIPDSAENIFLQYITNKANPESLELKLYSNDVTPSEDDDASNYTEVAGGGYSSIVLTPSNWSIVPGDPSLASYPQIDFVFTAPIGNVYGYYVVQSVSGNLMWAERFSGGPFNIQNNGDEIGVTVKLTLE